MTAQADRQAKNVSFVDPVTFTPHFAWKKLPAKSAYDSAVVCEKVPLADVAAKVGTPTYLYSRAAIDDAHRELHRGLGGLPHTLCFAVKSNGNTAILKHLAKKGNGFDIVSGGELDLLRRIGVRGDRIVFSGIGKSREEIREALRYPSRASGRRTGILLFNVESGAELDVLLEEAQRQARRGGDVPGVSIRVNPDVQAGGHPHISTGRYEHKFGLEWEEARRLYRTHRNSKWIRWEGISVHIGSQIVSLEPFRRALARLANYVVELRSDGIILKYLDFGGGLGVRYTNEMPPSRQVYARMVAQMVRRLDLHLLLEPGRTIMAPAGVLLTRVVYVKENGGKTFVVVDAAMNDLMRPALYGAIHPITRLMRGNDDQMGGSDDQMDGRRVDVVGPVCETGDCFLRDWPLGRVAVADVLGIWSVGAYGMAQASNYNARRRPAEVLVEGSRWRLIRRRETRADLLRGQIAE